VNLGNAGEVLTLGEDANAITAQSVGGGGGNGGFSIAGGLSVGPNASISIGGGRRDRRHRRSGHGDQPRRARDARGRLRRALRADVGGGGGNGGFSVAGGISGIGTLNAAFGGGGASGGAAGDVTVNNGTSSLSAGIETLGSHASGIVAQSVGGGGGNGGFSVAGGVGADAALGLSIGGSGGAGSTPATSR